MATFNTYAGVSLHDIDSELEAKDFYQYLFQLSEATILLSKANTMDELYKIAIETAVNQLGIDRIGILVLDPSRLFMQGTWGTDEVGVVRSEHEFAAPITEDVVDIISNPENKGKVCVWHDRDLFEFDQQKSYSNKVGSGWNAAIGLWEGDQLMAWIACDNLIKHTPFRRYQAHILRLFGIIIEENRLRFIAFEAIEQANQTLERKVAERTIQLLDAKQALETINAELESKVINRTAKLNHKNYELQKSIDNLALAQQQIIDNQKISQEEMRELVVGVAHEMNTPLGIAITANSILDEVLEELVSTNQQKSLQPALEKAKTAQSMIESSLTTTSDFINEFKRISSLEFKHLPAREVMVSDIFEHVIAECSLQEPKIHQCRIEVVQKSGLEQITIQVEVLTRVLESLLLNACQHGSEAFDGHIVLTADVNKGLLTFTVEDDGSGVAQALQDRMFRPFVTSARTQGNKGLGLSVVYNLVYFVLAGRLRYFKSSLNGAGFIIECPYAH